MPIPNQFSASRFALEIEGKPVGFVSSVSGGEAFAQVIATADPSGVVEKRPGDVEYAPIVLEADTSLGAGFYHRVTDFLHGSQKPISGVISYLDQALVERARLEWTGGLITEVAFPAADAGGKDSAQLRVTIQPESTRRRDGSGGKPGGLPGRQKRWIAANFRFSITGLENETKRVNRVESLVLRRTVTGAPKELVAGSLEVPDVVFTVAASEGESFYDWFDDFIVRGNNSPGSERNGSLVFLDQTLKDELIGVAMQGLGILRVSEERVEARAPEAIARVSVRLYCEGMELSPAPG